MERAVTEQSAVQESTVGVVLAGGASRRMRRDKATLPIGGEPLVWRVVRRMERAVPRVVVVGPAALRSVLAGRADVVPDRVPGLGPLGGLASALEVVDAQWLFVVACDMPFVAPRLVRAMLDAATASPDAMILALRTTRGPEPLHAVYARSCAAAVEAQLTTTDHSLHGLLSHVVVRELPAQAAAQYDPAGLSAFNANAPAEWEQALRLAAAEV